MKTKVLFFVVLALITFSCRTIKQKTTSNAEVKTSANLSVNQSNQRKLNIDSTSETKQSQSGTLKTTDTGTVEETVEETSTQTNYSTPDSTGKQYPVSTVTNKKTTHRGVKNNLNTIVDNKSTIDYLTRNIDKSDFKFDESIKDKGKSDVSKQTSDQLTQSLKTPAWVYIVALVSFLILLLIIYIRFIK